MNNHYNSELRKILETEQLADLSQFHRRESLGSLDEVPLFSREADIDFLLNKAASEILLRFALTFLHEVIAYEKHPKGYFAAITVWSHAADPLIPHLFTWCGDIRDLKDRLVLSPVTSSFAKTVKKLVSKLHLNEKFAIREDTSTVPGATRLFIAPESPPYPGFVPLSSFSKAMGLPT